MLPLCSGGPQPVPLPVLREPARAAEEADGGGGEGAEPAQLRQGAEAPQGALKSATARFAALGCPKHESQISGL